MAWHPYSTSLTPAASTTPDQTERAEPIWLIATTRAATAHALAIAAPLAHEQHRSVTVLASQPRHVTVSSVRANVHDLPMELPLDPETVTADQLPALLAEAKCAARIEPTEAYAARELAGILPAGATVVLAGPIHHFVEAREQRLARRLANMGFEVVFLPMTGRIGDPRQPMSDDATPPRLTSSVANR
jgi:hypothetical protein